jgi:methyl-accepting chemotaxis protein
MLSFVQANGISKPLTQLLGATKKLSSGDLSYAVGSKTGVIELDNLAESFNEMSAKIDQREQSLKEFNEKLTEANKSYIDLIGFVSHELKGILAFIMNAYAARRSFGDGEFQTAKRAGLHLSQPGLSGSNGHEIP